MTNRKLFLALIKSGVFVLVYSTILLFFEYEFGRTFFVALFLSLLIDIFVSYFIRNVKFKDEDDLLLKNSAKHTLINLRVFFIHIVLIALFVWLVFRFLDKQCLFFVIYFSAIAYFCCIIKFYYNNRKQ